MGQKGLWSTGGWMGGWFKFVYTPLPPQVGGMLVMFGGQLVRDGSTTNDVFWMTLDRMEWHNTQCKGDKPCPRYNHTAVYDEDNQRLVIFGGRNGERKRLNDVYCLDLESFTWSKRSVDGTAPSPREHAVAAFWAGNMVIFGEYWVPGRGPRAEGEGGGQELLCVCGGRPGSVDPDL